MSSGDPKVAVEIAFTRLPPSLSPNSEESVPPTIVFLHGSESCNIEFSRVAPFLTDDYEVILVDLPGHSRSKAIPFSFDNAINGLLHLIKANVKAGKVHLVGLSLGGFIGIEFARRYPDLLLSLWGTGCAPFTGFRHWLTSQSRLLSGAIAVAGHLATEKIFWASLSGVEPIPGFRDEVKNNQTMSVLKPVFDDLALVTLDNYAKIRGVRIAMIAGGKGDNVEETTKVGKLLRSNNPECSAFVVREAIHWWSLQFPEIFAQGVRAWIERREMPKEYEPLLTPMP